MNDDIEREKIYKVTFREYTTGCNDTVCDRKTQEYLEVPEDALVKESDLEYFKKFGRGFDSIVCVGELMEKNQ